MNITLPESLYNRLAALAEQHGRTVNEELVEQVEAALQPESPLRNEAEPGTLGAFLAAARKHNSDEERLTREEMRELLAHRRELLSTYFLERDQDSMSNTDSSEHE